jgi:RNA-splicing ligase RtcB
MKTITGQHNTATVFATTVEESCEQQILDLCNEEWAADSKIRIMPDCHSGKGCVIGTTMTITDKVVPNLVGVDIGCGMLTAKFSAVGLKMDHVDKVIKNNIPLGRNIHGIPVVDFTSELQKLWTSRDYVNFDNINRSLGSLGGGNHFIEIDKDDEDCFYLVIHTGSRNFGKRVAEFYQDKAFAYHDQTSNDDTREIIDQMKANSQHKEISEFLAKRARSNRKELSYLEGPLFDAYLNDMKIAQRFAALNRRTILDILCRCLHIAPFEVFETIHNYIDMDNMILRKGAVSAREGEKVLIPINMHDGSLICVGKGNPDFNCSAPHGAGRLMSRNEAKKRLQLADFQYIMKGIYSSTVGESTLDEAPGAYKPIEEILDNIKDTVDVVKQIKPVFNIKAEE